MSSKLYRELKLRSAVVHKKQIKILPQEQIYSNLHGVWNLSSDQGSLGTLIITNVRLVWFADMNEGFNISLPHLQIATVSCLPKQNTVQNLDKSRVVVDQDFGHEVRVGAGDNDHSIERLAQAGISNRP